MRAPRSATAPVRIVREDESGTLRNVSPRGSAPTRAQRIVADIARQITPLVERALSGVEPPIRTMDFTRKGFRDGVRVRVIVSPLTLDYP